MIIRVDRLPVDIPQPKNPNPDARRPCRSCSAGSSGPGAVPVEVGPDVEGEMFKEFAEKMFGKGVMTKPSARR